MNYTIIILIAVVLLILMNAFRIASENERFAVFILGKYAGLKGPGLVLKFPGKERKWVRIKVGDRGELDSPEIGTFQDVQLPLEIEKNIKMGSIIRVVGFTETQVKAMMDPEQRKTITCEKCGHEMHI